MRPTNDDKDAVAIRYKKKKSKTNEKSTVHFEPEKYEAALRSILGMILISQLINYTFTPFILFLDFKIPEDNWDESNSSDMDSYGSDCEDLTSGNKYISSQIK